MAAAAEAKFRSRKSWPTRVRSYIPISRDEVDFLLASDPLTAGLRLSRQRPQRILLQFERLSWSPVALARAILLLQIQRLLDPSRTPANPFATNILWTPHARREAQYGGP